MRIQVNGKHIDIGDALRSHVEDTIDTAVRKYSERPVEAVITFSREGHGFRCDSSVHLSTGLTAKASSQATDIYACFDAGVERIEKQLRRYKRRLKDHHKTRPEPIEAFAAPAYVLASSEAEEEEPESLQPIVIAEMTTDIKSLSVGEAVMQMEFDDSPFLMFQNESHGGLNVVFRRDDGNIGWIDPKNFATS